MFNGDDGGGVIDSSIEITSQVREQILTACTATRPDAILGLLLSLARSGKLRDVLERGDSPLYAAIAKMARAVIHCATENVKPSTISTDSLPPSPSSQVEDQQIATSKQHCLQLLEILAVWITCDEFDADTALAEFYRTDDDRPNLAISLFRHTKTVLSSAEFPFLRTLLHSFYRIFPSQRPLMRGLIFELLEHFNNLFQKVASKFSLSLSGAWLASDDNDPLMLPLKSVSTLLEVMGLIVQGTRCPLHPDGRSNPVCNWLTPLLKLHHPSAIADEFNATLGIYHEQLVFCCVQFLKQHQLYLQSRTPDQLQTQADQIVSISDSLLETIVLRGIITGWPTGISSNTPKELLLIHEIEAVLEFANASNFTPRLRETLFEDLLPRCVCSPNHRIAEKVLTLWKCDGIVNLTRLYKDAIIPNMFFPIFSGQSISTRASMPAVHWNATVNKMRHMVLSIFRDIDEALFSQCCGKYWGTSSAAGLKLTEHAMNLLYKPPQEKENTQWVFGDSASPQLSNLDLMNFVLGRVIGEGSFSKVQHAKIIEIGVPSSRWKDCALKIMDKNLIKTQNYVENIKRELKIMQSLSHPNIIRLISEFQTDSNLYLVMEYASGGDLHTCIYNSAEQSGHGLNVTFTRFVAAEVLSALQFIHEQGIVFLDLKPENIVFVQGHAKLTDFGSAAHLTDLARDQVSRIEGTRQYLAPELHQGSQNASFASDVFALGCIIYQMLTAKQPEFCGLEAGQDESRVVRFDLTSERLFAEDFPPQARDLIELMCASDPKKRISLEEAKRHPFFENIDFSDLIHQNPPPLVSAEAAIKVNVDQRWQRRHNSIMWAPDMPKYKFQQDNGSLACIDEVPKEHEQSE